MTRDLDAIIRQAQSGDRTAFAGLIDDHYEMMFRFAHKYCGNRPDAEDVTQLACIKVARSLGQFRFEARFTTWLYRLVLNCARDFYKAQHSHEASTWPETAMNDGSEPKVLLHQVLKLVECMGEGFRETLALVIGEGLTHAEAAEVLAVKESTVSWRLHEVRKRLKADVGQIGEYGGGA
ncbi:RNA polymerase sigma factor [Aestuariicella hydrocarbonica]|uniref:RNA polymerase sigma factor n=1 Tax=Pseudomaricurvus hydrocarbonicus TaxID=1470433 RepID=A0A9E5K0B7_9GAMM|nr:RNA polymerase sigma factor [Aestuariicella hydrocarbonica]NHO66167.1 RNA polymerase sigma factor [Aestuariicella hydrocarbonica]